MRPTDYDETLRLLNTALALIESRHLEEQEHLLERLNRLALKVDLLRAQMRQAPAHQQRN